jgi:hypothetical protein
MATMRRTVATGRTDRRGLLLGLSGLLAAPALLIPGRPVVPFLRRPGAITIPGLPPWPPMPPGVHPGMTVSIVAEGEVLARMTAKEFWDSTKPKPLVPLVESRGVVRRVGILVT